MGQLFLLFAGHDPDLGHVSQPCVCLDHLAHRIANLVQLLKPRVLNELVNFHLVLLELGAGVQRTVVPPFLAVELLVVLVESFDCCFDGDGVSIRIVSIILFLPKVKVVLPQNTDQRLHQTPTILATVLSFLLIIIQALYYIQND